MGAPQARLSELGVSLVEKGWDVDILTAMPNYPSGIVDPEYQGKGPFVETYRGMKVARVPLYASKEGFVKRLACYGTFLLNAQRFGPTLLERPDVIWVESPPLFIGWAALSLSKHWRCPYVMNISDLWPESAIRIGAISDGAIARVLEGLEIDFYKKSAGVTGQSRGIIQSISERCRGVDVEIITNGVDPSRFGDDKASETAQTLVGDEEGPVFLYAGLLGYAQGIDQILDVAKAWPKDKPGRFVLAGDGPEKERLEARLRDENITRVKFIGKQPRELVPELLAVADAAFITLGMEIPGAVPSKIYEAMASQNPIVLAATGEPVDIVVGGGAGLSAKPGDVRGLLGHCVRLAGDKALRDKMGAAGRKLVENNYTREVAAERLDIFLRRKAGLS